MLLQTIILFLIPIILGDQDQYNCSSDGIPNVIIDAGQGIDNPMIEFSLPLFSNCVDTQNLNTPFLFQGGYPLPAGGKAKQTC